MSMSGLLMQGLLGVLAVQGAGNELAVVGAPSGRYDFLVYAVTWQPSFCTLYPSDASCREDPHPARFVTHGVWPYFLSDGGLTNHYPAWCMPACSNKQGCDLPPEMVSRLRSNASLRAILPVEPDRLIRHEWQKHGSCLGGGPQAYFNTFVTMRHVVRYDPAFEREGVGGQVDSATLRSWLPGNATARCVNHEGQQYLFELLYRVDARGEPYPGGADLRIGLACEGQIEIPAAAPALSVQP